MPFVKGVDGQQVLRKEYIDLQSANEDQENDSDFSDSNS